jgi:hypothetical protein
MWQPRSCPQPGGGSRCLDLKLVRGGTRSSGTDRGTLVHFIFLFPVVTVLFSYHFSLEEGHWDSFHYALIGEFLQTCYSYHQVRLFYFSQLLISPFTF